MNEVAFLLNLLDIQRHLLAAKSISPEVARAYDKLVAVAAVQIGFPADITRGERDSVEAIFGAGDTPQNTYIKLSGRGAELRAVRTIARQITITEKNLADPEQSLLGESGIPF